MAKWPPHVTVATVVANKGKFLMVEERDKTTKELVFNQPAGHLEPGETLTEAACRETLEETGWEVRLTGVLGIALHEAVNEVVYYRTTFLAEPIGPLENAVIDPDISAVHWLSYEEILANSARLRSAIVLSVIERYRQNHIYPLDLVQHSHHADGLLPPLI